jgi:Tfp pilus assembly protein PilF
MRDGGGAFEMSRRRREKQPKETRPVEQPLDAVEALLLRARKLRHRGETRKALVTLRQACNVDEWRARSWAILGAFSAELDQHDEARRAFERARWLNARAGFAKRAAMCAALANGSTRRAA